MKMKIKLDFGAEVPFRAHETDAGIDLFCRKSETIPARGSVVFDTGVHIELPPGYFAKIESKSGLNVSHGIVSCGGVIDEGYTGSITVKLYNMTDEPYDFWQGDKIAQLIIIPYATPKIEIVQEIEGGERGDNGFGSTGR